MYGFKIRALLYFLFHSKLKLSESGLLFVFIAEILNQCFSIEAILNLFAPMRNRRIPSNRNGCHNGITAGPFRTLSERKIIKNRCFPSYVISLFGPGQNKINLCANPITEDEGAVITLLCPCVQCNQPCIRNNVSEAFMISSLPRCWLHSKRSEA